MIKTVWSVTFFVSNLGKSQKFYSDVLGLERKYSYSSYVGFECGGVEIGLIPKPKMTHKVNLASPVVTFLVNDVEKFCSRLGKKGVKFREELHEETWGGKQASFTDPDGNMLEIVQMNWGKYFDVSAKGAQKKPLA